MKDVIKQEILAILGIAGPSSGIIISLSEVEAWLRITSLLIGIVIGCFSIRSLYLSNKRKSLKLQEDTAKISQSKEPD